MSWHDDINVADLVYQKTGATREEIIEKYKTSPDANTRGFEVNGHILGVDCFSTNNFIFYCCKKEEED